MVGDDRRAEHRADPRDHRRHTRGEREWAYDRAPVGGLEKGLDEAKARGWTVVDMKADWKRVFPFEKE